MTATTFIKPGLFGDIEGVAVSTLVGMQGESAILAAMRETVPASRGASDPARVAEWLGVTIGKLPQGVCPMVGMLARSLAHRLAGYADRRAVLPVMICDTWEPAEAVQRRRLFAALDFATRVIVPITLRAGNSPLDGVFSGLPPIIDAASASKAHAAARPLLGGNGRDGVPEHATAVRVVSALGELDWSRLTGVPRCATKAVDAMGDRTASENIRDILIDWLDFVLRADSKVDCDLAA